MTYVEIIVVLSIFSVIVSVSMYNYGGFQERVDIKNLASDIALQIVEAQKSALSGLLPPPTFLPPLGWKPSYGVYFNLAGAENKSFIYFTDFPTLTVYDGLSSCTGECLNKVTLTTKNSYISRLDVFYQSAPLIPVSIQNLTITFSRPDSGAKLTSSPALSPNISHAQITVTSQKGATSLIKIYPFGRIQVN